MDRDPDLVSDLMQFMSDFAEPLGRSRNIRYQHHIEKSARDGLGNVLNIALIIGKVRTYFRYDAHRVFSDHGNDGFLHVGFLILK
jgi:hypothetical protein